MAKQTEFESPPEGHVGLLVYDSVTNKWYAVLGDDDGHILLEVVSVALPTGAAIESKQLPAGHDVTIDNVSLAVTGAFYQVTQPISVASLPLPSGAAIESKQNIMITALQSLQNLVGALHDVGVDELDVNIEDSVTLTVQATGSDKIFSFESVVADSVDATISGAAGYVESNAVPANKVWVITNVVSRDVTRATTAHKFRLLHDGAEYDFYSVVQDFGANERVSWTGTLYMDASDRVRIWFVGGLSGDVVSIRITGYQMDAT